MTTHSTPSLSFPSLFVDKKDENWYRQYVEAIQNRAVVDGYVGRYTLMNECVNFYLGLQGGADEFEFLQKAEDGDILPAKWIDLNKIGTKVDLLIGELQQRGYNIRVQAMNKEAVSKKLDAKKGLLAKMILKPYADQAAAITGMPLQQGYVPRDRDELDYYMDKEYKDISEIVVGGGLRYLCKLNHWDYQRIAMFRDLLVMGAAFCRLEIVNGIPKTVRVDPRYMVWDVNAKDDFLSDSTYFGELCYMSIHEIVDRYKITEQELKEAYNNYTSNQKYNQQTIDLGLSGAAYGTQGLQDSLFANQTIPQFKVERGELRILVVKAFWQDYKKEKNKITTDNYGETHVKPVSEESTATDVKSNLIKIWRQGSLIGGKFLKEWGEMKNQARNIESLAFCDAPYKALIPNYYNGINISKVQQAKSIQKLINVTLYNLQLAMTRSGAKGMMYDVSQLPRGWNIETAIKYGRTAGIMFIDSKRDGGTNFNQFKDYDQTISQGITYYMEILRFLDNELNSVTGVNEARQGIVQNASQAVGVTQSALVQSSLSTAMYFDLFRQFSNQVLTHKAKLFKLAWAGKEKFAPIIGDVGVNFLEVDVDLDLHDYGVFIEEVPNLVQDKQTLSALVQAAINSQSINFAQALEFLLEPDIYTASRRFQKEILRKEKEAAEMAAQQQEQQAQQAQALEAQKQQGMYLQQQAKDDAAMRQLSAKMKADMGMKKMDLIAAQQQE